MKNKRFFLRIAACAAILTLLISTASCKRGDGGEGSFFGDSSNKQSDGNASSPSGWWKGAFECRAVLTHKNGNDNGPAPVSLTITRDGDVSTATVSAPEALAGMSVTSSPEGNHVVLNNYDITVSDEGFAGMKQILGALTYDASEVEFSGGSGSFSAFGADVTLTLGDDGNPALLTVVSGGYIREAAISNFIIK